MSGRHARLDLGQWKVVVDRGDSLGLTNAPLSERGDWINIPIHGDSAHHRAHLLAERVVQLLNADEVSGSTPREPSIAQSPTDLPKEAHK